MISFYRWFLPSKLEGYNLCFNLFIDRSADRESYFQKSLHIGLPDDEDGGHGALRGREEQGLAERELGQLRSEPLQGVFGLQVTCLKAQSSLAGTRLISSVEEVE